VSQRYYPYGGTRPNVGTVPTDYQFTGQKLDSGTGLYYYGARYYDLVTGRFISPDLIVPGAGSPQDLNRYAYTLNNPVRYTDPSGHCAFLCPFIVAALTVAPVLAQFATHAESFLAAAYVKSLENERFEASISELPPREQDETRQERLSETIFALAAGASIAPIAVGSAATIAAEARFSFDVRANRFRDLESGRFVGQSDLPYPGEPFASKSVSTVAAGTIMDRFGSPKGSWAGTPGTSLSERGLPPGSDALGYHRYRAVKPIPDTEVGTVAPVPAFGAKGGAIQYHFGKPISKLLGEYLEELP
jgi:RHS repeat-associated protein